VVDAGGLASTSGLSQACDGTELLPRGNSPLSADARAAAIGGFGKASKNQLVGDRFPRRAE
jgi:hypothetical protein